MARLEGLEPPTYGLEGRCSILLSYRRLSFKISLFFLHVKRYMACYGPGDGLRKRPETREENQYTAYAQQRAITG
jgi:hypothetical protein